MTLYLSDTVRNARVDAVESTIGAAAILKLYNSGGSPPANEAAAVAGTLLCSMTLPSDWMQDGVAGAAAKNGTWSGTGETGVDADADYFRVYDPTDTTCHMQGSAGDVGTEDLVLDNANIKDGQTVTITGFTITDGN